jgi:outer membrane protein assembly factor BamB
LLPDQPGPYPHLIVGAGKSGVIYLLNRDDLGQISGGDAQIVQETPKVLAGIYSKPGYFNNQVWFIDGAKLFIFSLSNGLLVTPPLSKNVNIGYPGATPVVSANGARNGIVWFLGTHGQVVGHLPAVLYAYDPVRGSQLYSSSQAGSRDVAGAAVKFTVPTIANGKVYIGTQNTIDVFGLLPQ